MPSGDVTARSVLDRFRLDGRVAIITGGGGMLGRQHARAITSAGALAVLVDVAEQRAKAAVEELAGEGLRVVEAEAGDITDPAQVRTVLASVLQRHRRIDILVNNAANDPKIDDANPDWSRLENFPLEQWNADLAVGLTGAFLCAQIIGAEMARRRSGVIVNIASDLALISPDQRLYRRPGLADDQQPAKPVSYSVVKTGLIGLTRYLATYWAEQNVRVNAISPGAVYSGQPKEFVTRLSALVPLGRMARVDEYQAALLFLCSDASSYMTGANMVIDGGRSAW